MKQQYYLLLIGLFLITINYYTCSHYKNKYQEQTNAIKAYQDTIKRIKTTDGKNGVQTSVIVSSPSAIPKTSIVYKLIKQGATSGTVIQQVTKYDTVTLVKIDTINNKPYFSDTTTNKWLTLRVTLNNDSLSKSVELRDSISVSFKKVRSGFLKPKKYVVEVSNANPYVKINNVQSFEVPKKQTDFKFWTGVAVGAVGGYLLFKK
jgi:hypothetical protein